MSLKKYFGALVINSSDRIDLGFTELSLIYQRAANKSIKYPELVKSITIHIAETKEQLESLEAAKSEIKEELSWSQQWAKEHPELITPIEEVESPIPGVSIEYWMERQSSPIYERWATLATNPEKRIGVPQELIDEARIAWEKHAPEIAPHFPKWKD